MLVLLDFLRTDFLPFKSVIFRTWENLETNVKHLFPITMSALGFQGFSLRQAKRA